MFASRILEVSSPTIVDGPVLIVGQNRYLFFMCLPAAFRMDEQVGVGIVTGHVRPVTLLVDIKPGPIVVNHRTLQQLGLDMRLFGLQLNERHFLVALQRSFVGAYPVQVLEDQLYFIARDIIRMAEQYAHRL